jgi:hypothetical protein
MKFMPFRFGLAVSLLLSTLPAIAAPILGQVDTFTAGADNWGFGGGPGGPPFTTIATALGGPGGASDQYGELMSTGSAGPGGRLVAINLAQWAGDYLSAGVNGIRMDLNNLGTTDLSLQLLLAAPPFGPTGPQNVVITQPFSLPAGSGWVNHTFSLQAFDLILLAGSINATLGNAFELRIFHNSTSTFPGPPGGIDLISAQLGIDNVTASNIPEPATMASVLGGLSLLGLALRRRQ